MFNVDKKRLRVGIMWRDYIKSVQNLEKYAINFSCWIEFK